MSDSKTSKVTVFVGLHGAEHTYEFQTRKLQYIRGMFRNMWASPEMGDHPRALRLVATHIKEAAVGGPVFVLTQHPYLVDEFSPDEVVVCAEGNSGQIYTKRLSEHPDVAACSMLRTGEFWAAEGEAWVVPPDDQPARGYEEGEEVWPKYIYIDEDDYDLD